MKKVSKRMVVSAVKKGSTTRRETVTRKQVQATQDLGGGFRRWVFTRTIAANQFFFFTFNAGNLKIISNGFWISGNLAQVAYPTSFYPQTPNIGITVVHNPTGNTRTIQFFFITKT